MLCIQDPTFNDSFLLHEALLEACNSAIYGAGTYAFVTADGVNMLMGDPVFSNFINRGRYHLIAGIDEITNTRALNALSSLCYDHGEHLCVNAFLHDTGSSLYHPKFSWFKKEVGGVLVVGSGNLTQKGLRRNREAFVLSEVSEEEIHSIEDMWNSWLLSCAQYLKEIDDAAVLERAAENIRHALIRHPNRTTRDARVGVDNQPAELYEEVDEIDAWEFDNNCAVLIAEIPGKSNGNRRWNQANFDVHTFQTFFGAQPGVNGQYRLIVRNVTSDGRLGEIKHRPPVSVASRNYRLELTIEPGTVYPQNGRPLGVFVKLSQRTFLYMLVFPGDINHGDMQNLLNTQRIRVDRLVRYTTTVNELQTLCPTLPILNYTV